MKISTHITRRPAQAIALAVVVVGLALPAAAASSPQARPSDTSDVVSRYLSNRAADNSDAVSRYLSNRADDPSDAISRYVANVLRSSPAASAQQTALAPSDGFNWSVTLIATGGALAIVLLLSATGMRVLRHRRSAPKPA